MWGKQTCFKTGIDITTQPCGLRHFIQAALSSTLNRYTLNRSTLNRSTLNRSALNRSSQRPRRSFHPKMYIVMFTVFSLMIVRNVNAWGTSVKYAVNCPDRCNVDLCGGTQRCRRTVLDDCGCCPVCAADRGEHCYRTVSGMHGVKCGPGLFCEFYKDEDDYGDEYGICKDCMYGTYGIECRKKCNCKAGGICDRETGACHTYKFFAKIASKLNTQPTHEDEVGSGADSTSLNGKRSSAPKWLPPR